MIVGMHVTGPGKGAICAATMASPPSEHSGRRSVRKAIRHGLDRFKHSLLPSSRPPARDSAPADARSISPAPSATPSRTQPVLSQEKGTFGQSPTPSTPRVGASTTLPAVNIVPAPAGSTTIDKLREVGSVAWSGLEAALRVLEKSADVFPPLKLAVGGFVDCLDIIQVSSGYLSKAAKCNWI